MAETRNEHNILAVKPKGKRLWRSDEEERIMDFKKIVYDSVAWIHLAQDRDKWQRLVNTVMRLLGTKNGGKCFDYLSEC
jgi:hypothetical protein